ncbi:MAG: hypothetical protein A3J42_07775 [Candidatus Dadabacteria bacterium RIFCSPHIGHO2_12_FULL_53_21]|nr:MAG: hypothetical protein A3J42_07775 [Candidatus Dadabacteria bacterium RIFCSPHIGHO2_12_FULL_53_21]
MFNRGMFIICLLLLVGVASQFSYAQSKSYTYSGMCDGSAAVKLDENYFIVAEDDGEVLRIYKFNDSSVSQVGAEDDVLKNLTSDSKDEVDIEGAARIGNRIYWISSHGRNKDGEISGNRYKFFATDLDITASPPELSLTESYDGLVTDVTKNESWKKSNLTGTQKQKLIDLLNNATRMEEEAVPDLAPEKSGLNIEGLAQTGDGKSLLIGLRNPLINGKAIIITLTNPADLVTGKGPAKFGNSYFLELGGLGIRDMIYSTEQKTYFIIGGPLGSDGIFEMFEWDGTQENQPTSVTTLKTCPNSSPEAVIYHSNGPQIQIINDEGDKLVGEEKCKKVKKPDKSFTDKWYDLN